MNFSDALTAMKAGQRARRRLWRDLGGRVGSYLKSSCCALLMAA